MTSTAILLLLASVCSAAIVGNIAADRRSRPLLTWSFIAILACCLVVQLWWPHVLNAVERNSAAVREGQLYRLFTALWFQDGGIVGGIFNLTMLAIIGTISERIFGVRFWLAIYFGGGLLTELVALSWQPIGAGNSVAYMSLAGALLLVPFVQSHPWQVRSIALLGTGAGLILCLIHDVHGAAVVSGAGVAWLFNRGERRSAP